jgi:D-alanyl-D-alanine carboxypeptidase
MNIKRAIGGPLLSIVFLLFFAYIIAGLQWVLDNSFQGQDRKIFLGSFSDSVQNTVTQNMTQNIIQDPIQGSLQNIAPAAAQDSVVQDSVRLIDKPDIKAKSAISIESNLRDMNSILFEKEGNMPLPIASLTKLMTAVVALDNYNLSDTVVVDEVADSQDPMKQDVKLGDAMPVESFLDIMLIESSNKSAYALSEGPRGYPGEPMFVSLMNKKAKDLGMENTFFVDPTGLSSKDVSTANDLVKLAEYILNNYPKISVISKEKEFNVPGFGKVTNTDQLLGEIPDIICSKTGFTQAADGCLLLVVNNPKNNDYLINVILGAENRFSEMKKLINWSSASCQ